MNERGTARLIKCAPIFLILWSCLQLGEFIDPNNIDVTPPICNGVQISGETRLDIVFDEDVFLSDELSVPDRFKPVTMTAVENRLNITLGNAPAPGEEFIVSGFVRDARGNETGFVLPVYGYNPSVPVMIINECTPQGSSSHPDFVEILAVSDGNMGGVCLYEGVPGESSSRFVFPQCIVKAGDYLLIHCKPEGTAEEINETADKSASGGIDASPDAWDFWIPGGDGLSGNNGTVSLFTSPGGRCIDALLYSNRTSSSDEKYRGFGSTGMMMQADFLAQEGAWTAERELIRPEDAVNPEDSTATRSISRMKAYTDDNGKNDWHITPSGGFTPGGENSDEIYR